MSEPFLGQIMLVGFNFAPRGWAFCDGQLLSISQDTALFSLLGTAYGGDGITTFALPDLRGRAAIGFGQGAGQAVNTSSKPPMTAPVTLDPATVQPSGGSGPHANIQPALALNYIIALEGIFPSRN